MPWVYCCSPNYLQRNGIPKTPAQIKTHRCITHGGAEWIFKQGNDQIKMHIHPVLRSNHGEIMRDAAIASLGITCLPAFYVIDALKTGLLIPLLEEYTVDIGYVYAVYPQHKQSSLMIRAFVEHLQKWFK